MAVSSGASAEIVAWKVPLSRFAIQGTELERLDRLMVPPDSSPFFGAGDELWNLPEDKRLVIDPPLEWAVWNATTSTLVSKSGWSGIWQLNDQLSPLDQPMQCRVAIDVFQVPKDGGEPSDKEERAGSVSLVTRSGLEAKAETRLGANSLHAKVETLADDFADLVDLKLEFACGIPSQAGLDLATELTLRAGQPVWVARYFDGTRGLDFRVSVSFELADGTPSSDVIRIQTGNGWRNVIRGRQDFGIHRVGYDEWLGISHAVKNSITNLKFEDPFQDPANLPREGEFAQLNLPESVKTRFANPVRDLRGQIEKAGVGMDHEELAGYDPLTETILFFAKSAEKLDLLEERFNKGRRLSPRMVIATFDGLGQTRIVSRSQGKATLIRSSDGKEVGKIEIAPTIGEKNDRVVDLCYAVHDRFSVEKSLNLDSSITLRAGNWQEISGANDDESGKRRAKVEVIQLD